jgi:3-oxoacyl-ACP reductase-like protein
LDEEGAAADAGALGSTTLSASIVAIAASVAEPPLRRISTPAAAALGSAALTIPCACAAKGKNRTISSATSFFMCLAVARFGVAAKTLRQPLAASPRTISRASPGPDRPAL